MIQTLSRNKQHWKAVERDPQTDFKTWRRRPLRSSQSGRSPHCCLSSGLYRKGLLRRHPQVFPVALRSQASLRWNGYFVRWSFSLLFSLSKSILVIWSFGNHKSAKQQKFQTYHPYLYFFRLDTPRHGQRGQERQDLGSWFWRLSQVHFCPWRHSHIRQVRDKSGLKQVKLKMPSTIRIWFFENSNV